MTEPVKIHLVDGTYEIFRAFFAAPSAKGPGGREVGATRALIRMWQNLVQRHRVTHVALAFDHVIESFRNELFDGYKTGAGLPIELTGQFELAERLARALGFVVWPEIEFEADDALATGAARFAESDGVEQVLICSPDKDLSQCVRGSRVVCFDRFRNLVLDEEAVGQKFGVGPASIPDWLALVGDDADGIPGVPKWGARSAAQVLARWRHVDDIPDDPSKWEVTVRGAASLASTLREHREPVRLYRRLATLRTDAPQKETVADLAWRGIDHQALRAIREEIGDDEP